MRITKQNNEAGGNGLAANDAQEVMNAQSKQHCNASIRVFNKHHGNAQLDTVQRNEERCG